MEDAVAFEAVPRVLLVEDNAPLRDGMFAALTMGGYKVYSLPDGANITTTLEQFRPDLVILDVYLPDGPDGFQLAEVVRARTAVPIVFITAADALEQRLRGFELGADDYVSKPVAMAEVLARTRAVLRRAGRLASPTWEVGDLVVDEGNRTAIRCGHAVDLTAAEFDLLCTLGHAPGKIHSKMQLLSHIWGFEGRESNLVEVNVSSLRRKLEAYGPRLIYTLRGRGYMLRQSPPEASV